MSDKATDFFASTLAQHLRSLQAVATTTDKQRDAARNRMSGLIQARAPEIYKSMKGPDVLLMHLEHFIELANFIEEPESLTRWLEQKRKANAVQNPRAPDLMMERARDLVLEKPLLSSS
jgi:hypothetical protein